MDLDLQETFSRQLQDERLQRLCDDNAFVNVAEVLRRHPREANTARSSNVEIDFLDPGCSAAAAPPRVHLNRFFLDQHRAYLKALGIEEDGKQRQCGDKASRESSLVSSWSSAASSEVCKHESAVVRHKRQRGCGNGNVAKSKKGSRMTSGSSVGLLPVVSDESARRSGATVLGCLDREYEEACSWYFTQHNAVADIGEPSPSFVSLTAPPPFHAGGYHLCSVCLLPANYRCVRCRRALFCSIECHVLHEATRCMKFIV
ncbi:HIT zinc finger [Trypanosoma vivax]|uniref:HIT-type domain-containing protein n=1 Tax=Trypanosoma vivax (strain Y486) TaxID=1055687 RepID=G0UBI6_TRYVY|nr:hypothetical protein TRVL_03684 [Trypanosoma vivax]KAH8613018.1 HIT zinc finger [Trypanosoma vivax]CCC53182.1 conserved hypothetical protein [Trypanosoma vivax Y486]